MKLDVDRGNVKFVGILLDIDIFFGKFILGINKIIDDVIRCVVIEWEVFKKVYVRFIFELLKRVSFVDLNLLLEFSGNMLWDL